MAPLKSSTLKSSASSSSKKSTAAKQALSAPTPKKPQHPVAPMKPRYPVTPEQARPCSAPGVLRWPSTVASFPAMPLRPDMAVCANCGCAYDPKVLYPGACKIHPEPFVWVHSGDPELYWRAKSPSDGDGDGDGDGDEGKLMWLCCKSRVASEPGCMPWIHCQTRWDKGEMLKAMDCTREKSMP